ncbi:MAG: response regulator [Bacteroidales bacterium]|nr:response regulator [Bacteroidales bacterium]
MRPLHIVVLILWLPGINLPAQYSNVAKFVHVNRQGGLTGNTVNSFYQDSRGFVWLGTDAGLNRFDGFGFRVFKTNYGDSLSISSNSIFKIVEDNESNLWFGTESGLNKFNRFTETFTRYFSVDADTTTISSNYITALSFHESGVLFIGTRGGGLCRYNKHNNSFSRIVLKNNTSITIGNNVTDMLCLPDGRLAVLFNGTNLVFFNAEKSRVENIIVLPFEGERGVTKLTYYQGKIIAGGYGKLYVVNVANLTVSELLFGNHPEAAKGFVTALEPDKNGILWIGSSTSGLFLIDIENSKIVKHYQYNEFDPHSLTGSDISALLIEKSGKVWVGTWGSGVCYYHPSIFKFETLENTWNESKKLPANKINSICIDAKNTIWVATEKGLAGYIYDKGRLNMIKLAQTPKNEDVFTSVLCDSENNLWAGSFLGGLKKFDRQSGKLIPVSVVNNAASVKSILEYKPGILWLATMADGIIEYNIAENTSRRVLSGSVSSNYISSLIKDKDSIIWIGTNSGLNTYNAVTGAIRLYRHSAENHVSLSGNHIHCLYRLSDGHLVIGTAGGLNIYNKSNNTFYKINSNNGLQNDYICSIEEDNLNRIWVSTLSGLSSVTIQSYEPLEFRVVNYSSDDGVQAAGFRTLASAKTKNGILLFGGNRGINFFDPANITSDKSAPVAIITGFYLNNRELLANMKFQGRVILNNTISETTKIGLKHNENMLTFDFSVLGAVLPSKCLFKYKLEGFDKSWKFVPSERRRATYTNIPPGQYILRVAASDSDGTWSGSETTLFIDILPPLWKTKLAIGFYGLFVLVLLVALRWIIIVKERKRGNEKFAVQEAARQHELDLLKIKFFTNISHEFRTPLTLIITPLEKIIKELKYKELEDPLQTIYRNSKRLLNLVNQLLDFRKLEVSGLKLNPSMGDIVAFLKEMAVSFTDLALKKKIALKFRSGIKELFMQFDHDKMEKIMFNLLSNAFKYTLENGEITVEIDYIDEIDLVPGKKHVSGNNTKALQVKVRDTGIGIPADKLDKIFERFIQADKSNRVVEHGTGIGLSLTLEFVKLHGGEIWSESIEGQGSSFIFKLPVEKQIISLGSDGQLIAVNEIDSASALKKTDSLLPVVLIVEDNEDLRFYLRDNLGYKYNILEADNGKTGTEMALAEIPDLIISDIMMPVVDGIELCRTIKTNASTSHIPIILLTAKTSDEQKKTGFEEGADAYVTKPFSFEVLDMQVKNLINQRKSLKELFNKKIEINPSEISVTTVDEKLIRKALEIVEQNISNPGFSVEQLGRELGMSRVHLYKKLLSLTGKSPIEFIRVLRLKRAAQLLQKSQLRVSEIAYEVGFNNPKYFSRYFKDEFNMLPSEYAAKHSDGNPQQFPL